MQSIEQLLKELLDSVVTLRSNAEADVLRREATQKALGDIVSRLEKLEVAATSEREEFLEVRSDQKRMVEDQKGLKTSVDSRLDKQGKQVDALKTKVAAIAAGISLLGAVATLLVKFIGG